MVTGLVGTSLLLQLGVQQQWQLPALSFYPFEAKVSVSSCKLEPVGTSSKEGVCVFLYHGTEVLHLFHCLWHLTENKLLKCLSHLYTE